MRDMSSSTGLAGNAYRPIVASEYEMFDSPSSTAAYTARSAFT